jgi:hypothetical protein
VKIVIAMIALSGCASAEECATCPTAQLTANGSTQLTVAPGTMVAYAWTSTHADTASSTATMTTGRDGCGNKDGAWVIDTPAGMTDPLPILACQSGTTYTLELRVEQTESGALASSTVTIAVD